MRIVTYYEKHLPTLAPRKTGEKSSTWREEFLARLRGQALEAKEGRDRPEGMEAWLRHRIIGAAYYPKAVPHPIWLRPLVAPLCCELQLHLQDRHPSWDSVQESLENGHPIAVEFTPRSPERQSSHVLLIVGSLIVKTPTLEMKWSILIDPGSAEDASYWIDGLEKGAGEPGSESGNPRDENRQKQGNSRLTRPARLIRELSGMEGGSEGRFQDELDVLKQLKRSSHYLLVAWHNSPESVRPLPFVASRHSRKFDEYLEWTHTFWLNLPGQRWLGLDHRQETSRRAVTHEPSNTETPSHLQGQG
jgi:hypothetical protein